MPILPLMVELGVAVDASLVDAAATSSSALPSALGSSPTAVAYITTHPTARHGRLPIWSGWHHLSASSGGRWCSLWKVY
eukprot:COSAG01_NODE_551_length_15579_cov_30.915181_8_plen_79_part_00